MLDQSSNNKRIAKNTLLLYFRMMLMMAVALYTSRVVLSTLGVEDYGIYNVVGGFVSMFCFLNGAMSGGTQRFISFALGKGDKEELRKIFSTCFLTHALIALLIFLLAETVGLWFVIEKLNIPDDRMTATVWVYQCSILSSIVMILSMPYNAEIVAHEKMSAFAYISIFEAFLKLGIAFLLLLGNCDRLILYAILHLAVSIIIRCIYTNYCNRKFEESHYTRIWDKSLFSKILYFCGWNLWGNMSVVLMTQGLNVVLNMFFGPAVNAARALAVQVQGAVHQFSTNFQMALNPQITKQYAANNITQMHLLIFRSAKFTFFLLLCISLPIFLETPRLLSIWLKDVPDYTIIFVRLMMCVTLIDATSNSLVIAANATGKIKKYQMVVGGILLMIVPLSYAALKLFPNPALAFVIHIFIAVCAYMARLYMIRPMINLSLALYVKKVFKPIIFVAVPSIISVNLISQILGNSLQCSVVNMIQSVIITAIFCFTLGLSTSERSFILSKIPFYKRSNDRT